MQSKYFDNSTHANLIKKIVYSPHIDSILCLEQSSNKVKFYTHDCQELVIHESMDMQDLGDYEIQKKKF